MQTPDFSLDTIQIIFNHQDWILGGGIETSHTHTQDAKQLFPIVKKSRFYVF